MTSQGSVSRWRTVNSLGSTDSIYSIHHVCIWCQGERETVFILNTVDHLFDTCWLFNTFSVNWDEPERWTLQCETDISKAEESFLWCFFSLTDIMVTWTLSWVPSPAFKSVFFQSWVQSKNRTGCLWRIPKLYRGGQKGRTEWRNNVSVVELMTAHGGNTWPPFWLRGPNVNVMGCWKSRQHCWLLL